MRTLTRRLRGALDVLLGRAMAVPHGLDPIRVGRPSTVEPVEGHGIWYDSPTTSTFGGSADVTWGRS